MLQLRRFDQAGRRAYLDEVRPRFVVLRLRAGKANFSWGVPLWAAEEVAALVLGGVALMKAALPLAPAAWRTRLSTGITVAGREVRLGAGSATAGVHQTAPHAGASVLEVLRTIDGLAGGSLRDVLRLPPGEPYVKVRTGDTLIEIAAY